MIHAFGECELDDELFELRRGGKPVKLEPKVFDVLTYLLRQRERVVTKDELLEALWPGVAVSESVLPKCVAVLRRAVGDTRSRPEVIQTVHGRGYRFVADVRRGTPPLAVATPAAPERRDAQSAFLGREQVLERLRSALDQAAIGRGRVVVLFGEPGIGKTRTAETLAAEARRRDVVVVSGRSYEGDGAPPFWPWVQILRVAADAPGMAAVLAARGVPPEVAALVPELDRRTPHANGAELPQGEEGRFRLFDGVAQLLKRAAEAQPIVVLLDDLHWADAASLRLLRLLASEIAASRLLVVATCRDHEPDPATPLAELLGALAQVAACEWITLGGLDREATATLIANVSGGPVPPELAAAVYAMTAGNPFFVQELARLLTAEGTVTAADLAAATRALPRRIRDAIRRRLAALSADCAALLRVAAVLGREFDSALLTAVAERTPDAVLAALAEARAARVLDAVGEGLGRYAFHHVLIQQTLYEELADDERARWHRSAGERLAALRGDDAETHLDDLARHFFAAAAAGDVARAVDVAPAPPSARIACSRTSRPRRSTSGRCTRTSSSRRVMTPAAPSC